MNPTKITLALTATVLTFTLSGCVGVVTNPKASETYVNHPFFTQKDYYICDYHDGLNSSHSGVSLEPVYVGTQLNGCRKAFFDPTDFPLPADYQANPTPWNAWHYQDGLDRSLGRGWRILGYVPVKTEVQLDSIKVPEFTMGFCALGGCDNQTNLEISATILSGPNTGLKITDARAFTYLLPEDAWSKW